MNMLMRILRVDIIFIYFLIYRGILPLITWVDLILFWVDLSLHLLIKLILSYVGLHQPDHLTGRYGYGSPFFISYLLIHYVCGL